MPRIRYQVAVSLDGYIAGPKGDADWIIMDPEIDFDGLFAQFDTFIMGRRTYGGTRFRSFLDADSWTRSKSQPCLFCSGAVCRCFHIPRSGRRWRSPVNASIRPESRIAGVRREGVVG